LLKYLVGTFFYYIIVQLIISETPQIPTTMKLITYKPIAFLLNLLANNCSSDKEGNTVISVNKNLSLLENRFVAISQQKSIGFSFFHKGFFNFKNNILKYILVGKNKSVVTDYNKVGPTPIEHQKYCYD